MINLAKLFKDYNEAGALNEHINLYGFVADRVFLTKSGDLGVVVQLEGIDYECLNENPLESITRRLEVAQKVFDPHFRIYQYLFKRNNATIPYQLYDNEVVNQAIRNRVDHLQSQAEKLYSMSIYYVILYQGFRHGTSWLKSLANLPASPKTAIREFADLFSSQRQMTIIDSQVSAALTLLLHRVESFISQLEDLCHLTLLPKDQIFVFLKRLLNFAPHKVDFARRKHDAFLDYYVADSTLECHRGHLQVDDYRVRVLTLKEPSSQSFPLIFKQLLEVQANFILCTEWRPEEPSKIQKQIQSKRRHYHNSRSLCGAISPAPRTLRRMTS
jgi:type IV secretory pathway VirB4 component